MPLWMCMKQSNMIVLLLIVGKYSPDKDIDVYLQPLIDELKQLYEEGAVTFDAYGKMSFVMCACELWIINDPLDYKNLSGWSNKSQCACHVCDADYDGV